MTTAVSVLLLVAVVAYLVFRHAHMTPEERRRERERQKFRRPGWHPDNNDGEDFRAH